MSIYISLFHALGSNHKVQSVIEIPDANAALEMRKLAKRNAYTLDDEGKSHPRYWNTSIWAGAHNMGSFHNASAITLEYKERHRRAVTTVLEQLGYKCFVIDTRTGFAVIFPLTHSADKGQYVRLVAVLSTIIGSYDLTGGCQAATFAFYPTDTAKVTEFGSEIIDTVSFIHDTFSLEADVGEWFKDADRVELDRIKENQKAHAKAIMGAAITGVATAMSQATRAETSAQICINNEARDDYIRAQQTAKFNDLFDRDDPLQVLSDRVGRLEAQMTNVELLVSYMSKNQSNQNGENQT